MYRIIKARAVIAGGAFFIIVFIFGLLWSFSTIGGLADAFIFKQ